MTEGRSVSVSAQTETNLEENMLSPEPQGDGCCSVPLVASESPMISQLEAELLMWVGLRPLPDRVRKPKLQSRNNRPEVRTVVGDYS